MDSLILLHIAIRNMLRVLGKMLFKTDLVSLALEVKLMIVSEDTLATPGLFTGKQ